MATLRQRRLARELRRLRQDRNLTPEYVAEQMVWSRPKLNRIENARVGITPDDVRLLLQFYGVDDTETATLVQLAEEARQRGWWRAFGDVFTSGFAGFEDEAAEIRTWQNTLVPGLLQTAAYARAVTSSVPGVDHDEVERRVRARMARRPLLSREVNPPLFHAVLAEGALRQQVGSPEVMAAQLSELWAAAQRPNVTIQVLPFAAGAHVGMDGPFVRLTFDDPADPDVIYVESQVGSVYLEDVAAHTRLRLTWELLTEAALTPEESSRFLTDLSKGVI